MWRQASVFPVVYRWPQKSAKHKKQGGSPRTHFSLSTSVCRMVADRSLDLCDWSLIHLSHVKDGCQVNVMLTSVQAWYKQNDQCAVLGWYMKYAQWGHVRRVNLPYKLPSVPLPPSSIFLTALKHAHALPTLSALHPPSPSSCMFFFLCSCLPSINHFTPIYFPLVCCVMSPNLSTCFYLSLRLPLLPVLLLCPFNLIFFFPLVLSINYWLPSVVIRVKAKHWSVCSLILL